MYGVMMFFILFVTVINFITPIKDQIRQARNASNLNCDSATLTTGEKATCIQVDWMLFAFVGAGLAMAIGYIAYKKVTT